MQPGRPGGHGDGVRAARVVDEGPLELLHPAAHAENGRLQDLQHGIALGRRQVRRGHLYLRGHWDTLRKGLNSIHHPIDRDDLRGGTGPRLQFYHPVIHVLLADRDPYRASDQICVIELHAGALITVIVENGDAGVLQLLMKLCSDGRRKPERGTASARVHIEGPHAERELEPAFVVVPLRQAQEGVEATHTRHDRQPRSPRPPGAVQHTTGQASPGRARVRSATVSAW